MRLKDKVIVVAGAGGRQGTVVPMVFAREGARVVVAGLDGAECERIAAAITRARAEQAVSRATDLLREEEAAAAVGLAMSEFGRIDVLYNNTGVYLGWEERAGETPLETWETLINVDLRSHFFCAKHAVREMIKTGGGVDHQRGGGAGGAAGRERGVCGGEERGDRADEEDGEGVRGGQRAGELHLSDEHPGAGGIGSVRAGDAGAEDRARRDAGGCGDGGGVPGVGRVGVGDGDGAGGGRRGVGAGVRERSAGQPVS